MPNIKIETVKKIYIGTYGIENDIPIMLIKADSRIYDCLTMSSLGLDGTLFAWPLGFGPLDDRSTAKSLHVKINKRYNKVNAELYNSVYNEFIIKYKTKRDEIDKLALER